MTPSKELDLRVAYSNKARALEEIFFCTLHPQLTGGSRREAAIKSYADACIEIEKLRIRV